MCAVRPCWRYLRPRPDRPAARAQETLFAHLGPQAPRPPPTAGGAPKYVALLSGLGVGAGGDPARLALAVDYLAGFLGGAAEQALAAQVRAPGPAGAQRARARPRSGAGEGLWRRCGCGRGCLDARRARRPLLARSGWTRPPGASRSRRARIALPRGARAGGPHECDARRAAGRAGQPHGSPDSNRTLCAPRPQVVRAVVAGGLLASAAALEAPPPPAGAPRLRVPALALGPLREADLLVAQLAGALPVDVMAGAADPANQALPQQALHACLLPTAAAYPTLARRAPSSPPGCRSVAA